MIKHGAEIAEQQRELWQNTEPRVCEGGELEFETGAVQTWRKLSIGHGLGADEGHMWTLALNLAHEAC